MAAGAAGVKAARQAIQSGWAVLPEASADPQNFRNSRRTLRGSPE